MATLLVYVSTALLCLILTNGSPCSEDWIVNGDQCYGFGSSHVSWIEATAICSLFGSSLAEVSSQGENDFITLELRLRKAMLYGATYPIDRICCSNDLSEQWRVQRAWIGATDMFNDSNWQWIGSKNDLTSFSDWFAQDESDLDEEYNCATIESNHNYQWVKDRCNHEYSFVCKTKSEGTVVG